MYVLYVDVFFLETVLSIAEDNNHPEKPEALC